MAVASGLGTPWRRFTRASDVCMYREEDMTAPVVRPVRRPKARQDAPKRRSFRLHQSKLDAARRVLGTTTETETIERALDLVVFGERLASGTVRARGRVWNDTVGEMAPAL